MGLVEKAKKLCRSPALAAKACGIPYDEQSNRHEGTPGTYSAADGLTFVLLDRNKKGRAKARFYIICPVCETKIPTGRFHQHVFSVRCKSVAWKKGRMADERKQQ